VDGASFNAVSATVIVTGNIIAIGAGTTGNQAIGMAWVDDGTRTYTIGTDVGANSNYSNGGGGGVWTASVGGGSGTITITTRTANRVTGSFSFQMQATPNSGATGTRTVTGNFNLTF
jgi:hypothetical protein